MTSWRRLLGFVLPHRALLASAFLAMVVLAATTGLYPVLIDLLSTSLFGGEQALDSVVGGKLDKVTKALAMVGVQMDATSMKASLDRNLFVAFAVVVLLKALSQATRFYAMGAVGQRVVADIRHRLFSAIANQSQTFFGDQATGFLVSRVINDVAQVERAATYALPIMIGDSLKVVVLAAMCLWQYPRLALVTVIVLPLAALPIVRFGKMLKRYARTSQEALGGLTNRITETLGDIRIVQVYGREAHEIARFERESESYVAIMMRSVTVRALQTPVMELIGVAALLGTMAYAQHEIAAGVIRPGEVIAFMLALVLMYEPLKAIGRLNGIVMPGLASAERVFEVIDHPSSVVDRPGATQIDKVDRGVKFEGVTFRYPGAESDALSGVDLELPRGKVVALAGPSGGGKSTVAALVPRLYDVTDGRVTVDGRDVRDVTLESLRQQIAIVTQETYLFNDTVRANIAYGRPGATDEEIEAASQAAHAHGFITRLPEGYDTRVGERGAQLSGGQRQRIAIARAFLRDAPILILDEATSALDTQSEREVQKALDALMENRTALVIAHRLSTIRRADEIVILEGGRAVERGTHDSLMAAGGLYANLGARA